MRLIVRTDAELDITEGFDWYEEQQTGLGHAFFAEISSVLITVEREPLRFPVALHPVRRAMAHRFPYGIFFIVGHDTISVIAAIHLARDPRRWHRRAK